MTDAAYVFDQYSREQKSIAASAFRKKSGKRGKGCRLPYEEMPRNKRKELNGPVKTYDLGSPMDFGTFKEMPGDLQRKYISDLKTLYGASNDMIAGMLGITATTFYKHVRGLALPRKTGKATWQQRESWKTFMNGVCGGGGSQKADAPECGCPSRAEEAAGTECKKEDRGDPANAGAFVGEEPKMREMRLSFAGIGSWSELYEQVKDLPIGAMAEINLEIKF